MIRLAIITTAALLPTLALCEDAPAEKPGNICRTTCQPVPNPKLQVCSKHCWSYRGGAGAVLVQTTVTWTSGVPVAKKTPSPAPAHPTEVSQTAR